MKLITGLILIIVGVSQTALAQAADVAATTAPSATMTFIKVFFALLLTLGFIAGLAWFAKRYQRIHLPTQAIKIVGGVSLGQRERAVLLQIGEVQLVVGVAPGNVNLLHVLNESVPVPSDAEQLSFAERLRQGLKHRNIA